MGKTTLHLALLAAGLVFAQAAWSAPADSRPLITQAKSLLNAGKAAEGYALLEKQQETYATDVEYNYLLGIAAMDAGKPGVAVFAFERVLALNPDHPLARAEMGRAMIMMGELAAARQELEQVKGMNPPPEAARRISDALAEIDRIDRARAQEKGRTIVSGYIEAEMGYDTNINTAPDTSTIFIPVLALPGTLSGFARSQESWLLGVNAGVSVYKPVNDDWGVFASLDGKARYHVNEQDFVPASLYGSAGARYTKGDDQFSFGLTQFTYYINQYHNDDQTGAFAQWQRVFSPQDMGGLFAQYVRADHPIARNLNTDLFMVGGFWNHAFQREGSPMLSLVAYAGDDRQLGDDPTVGRQLYGAKAGLDYHLNERTKLFGSFGTQYSRYGGTNIWFMTKREDTRYDFSLGVAYKPTREWTVTPQLLYTKNDSTVGFNDWDRAQALVTVRRDFF